MSAVRGNDGPTPAWLEYVEHTADMGIRVRARSARVALERAAWGMFSLLTDVSTVEPRQTDTVRVEAEPGPALLVAWLSALNVRHQTEHMLYSRFAVTDLAPGCLEARLRGERFDPRRHELFTEIKAVTLCALEFRAVPGGWQAQVIFDV